MQNRKMKKYFWIVLICLSLAGCAIGAAFYQYNHKPSKVMQMVERYIDGSETDQKAGTEIFNEGTAEWELFAGIEALNAGDYEQAAALLESAVLKESKDPATPIYAHFYLNKTRYESGGTGDLETTKEMLKLMADYTPLKGDADLIWEALLNSSRDQETDLVILDILKEYVKTTKGLHPMSQVMFKNDIATLEYFTGSYALALRDYYNALRLIDAQTDQSGYSLEKLTALSYIGDIHFNYEDYESAIDFYKRCIEIPVSDPVENAELKYVAYINYATACVETEQYEDAKKMALKTREITDYVDEATAASARIAANDVLARVSVAERDFESADRYLLESEQLYSENKDIVFGGVENKIMFTRATLLSAKKKYDEAVILLEEIEKQNEELDPMVIGYDYWELLLKLYKELGRTEDYIRTSDKQLKMIREDVYDLEVSHLSLGSYYAYASFLEETNTSLKAVNIVFIVLCFLTALVLILMVKFYLSMRRNSYTDQLTGLFNRKMLSQIEKRYNNKKDAVSMGALMMDIDFFKKYNDTYGHVKGDEALQKVARVLKEALRPGDVIIRYGGEEFFVLLENLNLNVAEGISERIQKGMQAAAIAHSTSEVSDYMTLSIGLCYKPEEVNATVSEMIQKSDEALYQSKKCGRNKMTEIELSK